MNSAEGVSFALYHYTPFLVNLQDCTFVRSTFNDFSVNHCPGLRRYTQWIYVGLVLVSASVMFSLIFWVVYARERRHRVYTKQVTGHWKVKTLLRVKAEGDAWVEWCSFFCVYSCSVCESFLCTLLSFLIPDLDWLTFRWVHFRRNRYICSPFPLLLLLADVRCFQYLC